MNNPSQNSPEKVIEFLFQETQIHFLFNPQDKNVMVNATEMAKIFDKEARSFLRLEGTKKYIDFLAKKSSVDRTDVYGQKDLNHIFYTTNKATFLCRKLAIKFAAWLSVEFEDWVIDSIDEILFSKNEKVAEVVHERQLLEREEQTLKERIQKEQNRDAMRLLEIQKRKQQLRRMRQKANDDLASQYEMHF